MRRGTESLAQRIVQRAPAAQLMVQLVPQVRWQSPPAPHERLPPVPTPRSQDASVSQWAAQAAPQLPEHVERTPHSSAQSVGPHMTEATVQNASEGHVHAVP